MSKESRNNAERKKSKEAAVMPPTMNRAFYDEKKGICKLGGLVCVGPDCRRCNTPDIFKEQILGNMQKMADMQESVTAEKLKAELATNPANGSGQLVPPELLGIDDASPPGG